VVRLRVQLLDHLAEFPYQQSGEVLVVLAHMLLKPVHILDQSSEHIPELIQKHAQIPHPCYHLFGHVVIKVYPLKVLPLVLLLSLNLLVDVFEDLKFVDFGRFLVINGMTHCQDFAHGLDRLVNGNVVTVENGKETSLEYFFVLFFVFAGKGGEFFPEVTEALDLEVVVLLVLLDTELKVLKLVVVLFEEKDQVHLVLGDIPLAGQKVLILFFEFERSFLNLIQTPDRLFDLTFNKLKILHNLRIHHANYLLIRIVHLLNLNKLPPHTLQPLQHHTPARQYNILFLVLLNLDLDLQLI
jgi:hypothetical protein